MNSLYSILHFWSVFIYIPLISYFQMERGSL